VKTLYQDLGLEQLYWKYEESSYQKLVGMIEKEAVEAALPKELFLEFASRIYKRNA
jgi:farnesyl diphosphate synthase